MNPLYQITNQFLFNRSINGSGYNEGLAKDRFEYVFHHRFCFRAFMSFRSIRSKKFLLLFSTFTAVVNHNGSYMQFLTFLVDSICVLFEYYYLAVFWSIYCAFEVIFFFIILFAEKTNKIIVNDRVLLYAQLIAYNIVKCLALVAILMCYTILFITQDLLVTLTTGSIIVAVVCSVSFLFFLLHRHSNSYSLLCYRVIFVMTNNVISKCFPKNGNYPL